MDRATPERETEENEHDQLIKERELMVQSANDILRITDGFQHAQKKSIRVIDLLYQENQELKQQAGLQRDPDPQGWRSKYGFPPAAPATRSSRNDQESNFYRASTNVVEQYDDDVLDEIEQRAKAVESELNDLLHELGEAERLASEERGRLHHILQSLERNSLSPSEGRSPHLVSSYQ